MSQHDDPEPITEREFRRPWEVHPDPQDGALRHKFGYEDMVMRRRALQWLEVALPHVSQRCREQQAGFALQRYWQSAPSFSDVCRVRSARAAWEVRRDWRDGIGERGGLTRPEWEYLVEKLEGVNDPVGRNILDRAALIMRAAPEGDGC